MEDKTKPIGEQDWQKCLQKKQPQSQKAKSSSTPTTWLQQRHVEVLLEKLCLVHAWFRRDYPTTKDKKAILQEYGRVITQKQITEMEFAYGCSQIASQKVYPNPGAFAELCRSTPQQKGMPSVEDAFREACDKSTDPKAETFSHLAVYLAGKTTGWFELRHCSNQQQLQTLKKNFREHYQNLSQQSDDDLIAKLPQPKPFHPLPPPPEHEKKATAAESREALRRMFNHDPKTED